jgi:hypothetical protein
MTLEFSQQIFEKNPQISNVMKISPVGSELFHANGRTDTHDGATSRFFAILRTRLQRQEFTFIFFLNSDVGKDPVSNYDPLYWIQRSDKQ